MQKTLRFSKTARENATDADILNVKYMSGKSVVITDAPTTELTKKRHSIETVRFTTY